MVASLSDSRFETAYNQASILAGGNPSGREGENQQISDLVARTSMFEQMRIANPSQAQDQNTLPFTQGHNTGRSI